ncbi:Receptor expression-enhancing protein [Ooceraea biroi]|uniref:Receptor expression-enhancing protein n=1 Tax=Ooceraea biroi TaxID=2015173 RepID=A0A026WC19_OOCBI|nr:Receptor expression-enhancing protein [Ooceraea biroi]
METRKESRSTTELIRFDKDDSQTDELLIVVNRRMGIGEILARQAMAWCRCWLQTFPIRMTLNNVGLLTVFLALVSPRSLIYRLVYPIFRLVFGTLYPAYASYKAVRTKNVKEYVKWMMYWIVFALFTCAETFTDVFFSFWFPFYYEIKIILVLWLLSPATKGSSILYRRFVHPALIRREAEIDEALARATEQGYTAVLHLGTKGVNYATTVLMQTAIKNLPIVFPTSALPDRQSDDPAISSLANPRTKRLSGQQVDEPDCLYDNMIGCSRHSKTDDLVMGDTDPVTWQDYHESTDDDDDDDVVQETGANTTDTECELLESERQPGGGGLVQQLRKSYSLSDLTGEKEDENRNTPDARDETDTEAEPRRREHVGRRGYSPRRTQSSSNAPRVDMYFSEVDVDVRQQRPREPVASLTNIRSSDDISSGYSSGEALQSQRVISQGDSLVRTSSVGARTRTKPRSTTKKTPEDRSEDFDRIDFPFPENISLPSSLNVLTPEQAVELLLLFSQSNKLRDCPTLEFITTSIDKSADANRAAMRLEDDESSSTESGGEFVDTDSAHVDVQTVQTVEIKHISMENLSVPIDAKSADKTDVEKVTDLDFRQDEPNMQIAHIDDEPKDTPTVSLEKPDVGAGLDQITGEICQQKIDELKQLLDDAHRAVTNIVSSQEKLNVIDKGKKHDTSDSPSVDARDTAIQHSAAASSSSCIFDGDNRAGKYHKKPAPKAPLNNEAANVSDADGINEDESQNALKATLVIKTGTLKTVSNPNATRNIFLAHTPESTKRKKKSNRLRAKEGFTKLLTIPKNIFHNAFHKEQSEDSSKEEDSSSTFSGTSESASRSGSIGSRVFMDASTKLSTSKQEVDVEEILLWPEHEDNAENLDKDINTSIEKLVTQIVTLNKDETDPDETGNDRKEDIAKNKKNFEKCVKNVENKSNFETREISRPRDGKKEIITDIN